MFLAAKKASLSCKVVTTESGSLESASMLDSLILYTPKMISLMIVKGAVVMRKSKSID